MNTPLDINKLASNQSFSGRCCITRIPTEVLCDIFRLAKDIHRSSRFDDIMGRYPSFDQIAISHVCRHWRDVSLQLPDLWTTLLVVRDSYHWDRLEAFLQRSQSQPLDIIIRWCPRSYQKEVAYNTFAVPILSVLSMVNLHSYRWRSFDLVADTGDAVDFALALFRPLRVPLLRHLRVRNITAQRSYEVGYVPWRHMNPVVPFEQFGAHLEELTVGSAFVNWDDRIFECLDFSGLKSLTMSSMYTRVGPTMVQLFNILSKCPNLTTLVCDRFEGQEHPPLPFTVQLPVLTSLDFVLCGTHRLADFIQHISAPNLRCFSLKCFCSLTMGTISTLMELGPDYSQIGAPTPLPATSFLQRLHALRICTPMSSGQEWRRFSFYERLQNVRALVLETTTESSPGALQLAFSELVHGRPPRHTSTSLTSAVLLPHLATLILMTPEAGLLRPFVEGRKNIGVPLRRLFANFASDYPVLEMEWLKQNLEVVGTVEKFWESEDGNLETWLALNAEPVGTARFAELCSDVGCVVSGGYALTP